MKNNYLLRKIKENDIVLMEIPYLKPKRSLVQLCRLFNIQFKRQSAGNHLDWLEFEAEILYSSSPAFINEVIGNCYAIKRIVNKKFALKTILDNI